MSYTTKYDSDGITSSISHYQGTLLKDINLKIRLVDDSEKNYLTTLSKWEDRVLTFAAPLYQRDWVIFPMASQFDCCFITKDNLYMARIELVQSRRTETALFYKAEIISPIQKKQQREHFRLELLLDLHYAILTTAQGEQMENVMKKLGTCVNLSVGGICMVSNEPLEQYQHLAIYFNFLDTDFIIPGKVLHNSSKNENGTFSTRIQFQHLDKQKENLLAKLIFEKQRILLKQEPIPLFKKSPNT